MAHPGAKKRSEVRKRRKGSLNFLDLGNPGASQATLRGLRQGRRTSRVLLWRRASRALTS